MPDFIAAPPPTWQIASQGDRTLLLTFGEQIDVAVGHRCAAAADALRAAHIKGVTDIVPAFCTVAVHYQPRLFGASTSFQHLTKEIEKRLTKALIEEPAVATSRQIDVPVCYGGDYGPDLGYVASHCGLTEEEVIRLHSEPAAYVFMLGFAPGAPYIGVHDERLAIPRRDTPRVSVPAGSVAIANRQTMIYPNASPGGWHIIGATPLTLFDSDNDSPTLLTAGDTIKFCPITPGEFLTLQRSKA